MHCSSSGRLPEDGHIVWVATKVADVVSDPLKSLYGVLHSVVSWCVSVISAQESQSSQTVVNGDHEDVLIDQMIWTVSEAVSILSLERSSMDPDHHRQIAVQRLCVNVQGQAVLIDRGGEERGAGAGRSVFGGLSDSRPGRGVNRGTETQIAGWWGSVRDSLPAEVVAAYSAGEGLSLHLTSCGLNDWAVL